MRKAKFSIILILAYILMTTFTAAYAFETGVLRIDPPLPIKVDSPADFQIWTQGTSDVYDPHIFLVIPKSCYDVLTEVTVSWTAPVVGSVTIPKGEFQGPETEPGKKIPPETSTGARYLVNQLQEKLSTSEPIYYVTRTILGGNKMDGKVGSDVTKYDLQITLGSSNPRMLVYILGKHDETAEDFDVRVPPTIPGFVIPEIPMGTVMALASTLTAFALLILKRRI